MRTSSQLGNNQQTVGGNGVGQQQQQNQNQPNVFHVKCFACSKCGCQLVAGDR